MHGWLSFSWILSANCKGKCRWKFFDSQTNWKGELVCYIWLSFLSQVWTLKTVKALYTVCTLYKSIVHSCHFVELRWPNTYLWVNEYYTCMLITRSIIQNKLFVLVLLFCIIKWDIKCNFLSILKVSKV